MNILFVHQGFPGQYCHILAALSSSNHKLVGIGLQQDPKLNLPNFTYYQYNLSRGNTNGIHPWLLDLDSKLIRGEACAALAHSLKRDGFHPDLICAHPGWGESLFLTDIWPDTPVISYQEFYYNSQGFDTSFDSEFSLDTSWRDSARIHLKNANPLLSLNTSTWNVTPTNFQKSSFPREFHQKISVIHDGVPIHQSPTSSQLRPLRISNDHFISPNNKNITFVNRNIEPYRGCHSFIRSIPFIQQQIPDAHIYIIGEKNGVSYGQVCPSGTWYDYFFREIDGQYDPSYVHHIGTVDHSSFVSLLRLSSCHVYLTYPFVLSWSLLEAMSLSLPIVGSQTPPVQEVIEDNYNGLLVDFFSPSSIADAVVQILKDKKLSSLLSKNARSHIINNYSIDSCVPRHISLMEMVASRVLP